VRSEPEEPRLVHLTEPEEQFEQGDLPPDVQKLDAKTWQRATYLALFFALILFAAFFYLVQTARRLNFAQSQTGSTPAAPPTLGSNDKTAQKVTTPGTAPPSLNPTLRLYTDLVPGSVVIDDAAPQ